MVGHTAAIVVLGDDRHACRGMQPADHGLEGVEWHACLPGRHRLPRREVRALRQLDNRDHMAGLGLHV
jgi:hypothetical protein